MRNACILLGLCRALGRHVSLHETPIICQIYQSPFLERKDLKNSNANSPSRLTDSLRRSISPTSPGDALYLSSSWGSPYLALPAAKLEEKSVDLERSSAHAYAAQMSEIYNPESYFFERHGSSFSSINLMNPEATNAEKSPQMTDILFELEDLQSVLNYV